MAQKPTLGIGAMLLLLVIAAGCVSPIVQATKTSLVYEFRADASMKYTEVVEGRPLPDTSEWEGDCTEKYRQTLDAVTNMLMMATAAGMAQGQAPDENVQKITAVLNRVKTGTVCHFTRLSSEKGVLETSMALSREDIGIMNELMGSMQQPGMRQGGAMKVENTPEGAVRFTLSNTVSGSAAPPAEVKLKVEGTLVSLEPSGYIEEGGYYKYANPAAQLAGKDLVVTYKPAALDIFALIPGGMLGLAGIIIAITALLGAVLFFTKFRQGVGGKAAAPAAPKIQPQAPQVERQKPKPAAVQQAAARPREGMPQAKTAEAPQKPAAMLQKPGALARGEEVDAAKLTIRLSKIAEKFSREEIMQSIAESGYSNAVAEEVARRLGK